MAVKIKLTRLGKIRNPQYRIAVADARTRRDGRSIEVIGRYHPKEEPSLIEIDSERAQYWLSVGAQPTEPVLKLLKITGDWQKFKGLPGAEGTLKIKEPGPSKLDLFNAALAEAEGGPSTEATTAKKKKAPAKKAAKATGAAGPATSGAEPAEAEASAEPAEAEATEAEAKPKPRRWLTSPNRPLKAPTPPHPPRAPSRQPPPRAPTPPHPPTPPTRRRRRTRRAGRGIVSSVVVDAVEHLVRGIVDNPDDVRVDMVTSRRGRTVEVHVHPDDLGKVIGRGGRTATALRTLVAGIGGRGIRVDVVDTDQ